MNFLFMTNLERARKGERIGIGFKRKGNGSILVSSKGDRDYLLSSLSPADARELHKWINQQIDHAVTHAIDDTPDNNPELWRDLSAGEIRMEGDRFFDVLMNKMTSIKKGSWFCGSVVNESDIITQRPVRKEDL